MEAIERLSTALADRYRIERELGQGGMATVYLAEDLKHKRKVAVKVLRPELAAVLGADRFVQEITTTAALQHPHILPLFDSGTAEGFLYYVMPFIDGETLRSKLDRETQLGIDEAVKITVAVADALDYAHRHGVIHRDIKPENILLHDGRPMVADFGIALAVSAAAGGRMTETGLSLGTPHYMSPEQATAAKEITARSDVYSLSSVLYEMLAGEPPHSGGSAQQIIMKIIAEEAQPVTQLRKSVPPHVAAAVAKALEKLPADRFASAAAFAEALSNPGFTSHSMAMPRTGVAPGRTLARRALEAAAWLAVGVAVAAWVLRGRSDRGGRGSAQRQQVTYSGRAGRPAVSADGRFVAYIETHCPESPAHGGCAHLEVLEVGSARPVEVIAGADRLGSPRWTHDGLALVIAGSLGEGRSGLFTVPRLGGTPRRLADEPAAYDTHPTGDSVAIVTAGDSGATLKVVAIASGDVAGATMPFPVRPLDLSWSPDGRLLAASTYEQIHLVRRADGSVLSKRERAGTRPTLRWAADGRSVLSFKWSPSQDDDLVSFPVTGDGIIGAPRLLASQVPTLLLGEFDVARGTGRVVIGSGSEFYDIWSFDLTGARVQARRLTQGTNWYGPPTLTADGRTLYYLRADPLGNSLYKMVDGVETAMTAERQMVNNALRLSADEHTIIFESNLDSTTILMLHDVAAGTSHWIRRGAEDLGWLLPGGSRILWLDRASSALSTSDADGQNRRPITITAPAGASKDQSMWLYASTYDDYGNWFLAPDGGSVALLGGTPDGATLSRAPLGGGTVTILAHFTRQDAAVGLAAWSPDGRLHLARRAPSGATSLVQVDAASGASRVEAELPARCEPRAVSYAPAGHRAACVVRERRGDIMLFDGFRP